MRKKFLFASDTSFMHVKDEMHREVTEHIIEDEKTKKLYHYVVNYGSWFHISYESIFMSHLLKGLGINGFCRAYIANDCQIALPWCSYRELKQKTVVQLPEFVQLKDFTFGVPKTELSEKFKETFVGKTFIEKQEGCNVKTITGKELLPYLFGCTTFCYGKSGVGDKAYPLYCLLYGGTWHRIKDLIALLQETKVCDYAEIRGLLERFVELDIEKEIEIFEDETKIQLDKLKSDLLERQEIVDAFLAKQTIVLE